MVYFHWSIMLGKATWVSPAYRYVAVIRQWCYYSNTDYRIIDYYTITIVLLYFCQCFIGYLPCGRKLGCSAGNNRVVFRQRKFLPMFYRLSPLWGEIGLFGGEQYTFISLA